MKLSKEELLQKISDKVENADVAIELLEDITDSFDETTIDTSVIDDLTAQLEQAKADIEESAKALEELKTKYKERFLSGEEAPKDEEPTDEVEENIVDIKEI